MGHGIQRKSWLRKSGIGFRRRSIVLKGGGGSSIDGGMGIDLNIGCWLGSSYRNAQGCCLDLDAMCLCKLGIQEKS